MKVKTLGKLRELRKVRFTRMLASQICEVHWPQGDCTTNGEGKDTWCWPCRARELLGLPPTKGYAEKPVKTKRV